MLLGEEFSHRDDEYVANNGDRDGIGEEMENEGDAGRRGDGESAKS